MAKPPQTLPCGMLPTMVPCGIFRMLSLPFHPIPPLQTSRQLSILPRDTLWSRFPHLETVAVSLSEWMTVGSVAEYPKRNQLCLRVCEPLIATISSAKGSVMSSNKVAFTQTHLAWDYWSIKNFSKEYFQAAAIVVGCCCKCHILRQMYKLHEFLFVILCFCCYFCSYFCLHFFSLIIFISVIFVPTLLPLCTCDYISVSNVCTVLILIIHVQTLIFVFQYLNLLCILCND